jgi:hypothetical protein
MFNIQGYWLIFFLLRLSLKHFCVLWVAQDGARNGNDDNWNAIEARRKPSRPIESEDIEKKCLQIHREEWEYWFFTSFLSNGMEKMSEEESEIRDGRQLFHTYVRAPHASYLQLAVICQSSFASIVFDSSCFWSVDASVEFSWWWFLASYLTALFAEISALIYLIIHFTYILLILTLVWHSSIDYVSINSINHTRSPDDWLKF